MGSNGQQRGASTLDTVPPRLTWSFDRRASLRVCRWVLSWHFRSRHVRPSTPGGAHRALSLRDLRHQRTEMLGYVVGTNPRWACVTA
jgi:hypothetical protein